MKKVPIPMLILFMVLMIGGAVAVSQMMPGTRHIQVHTTAPFVTLSTP